MTELEKMEMRWADLTSRSKSPEEVEEQNLLGKKLSIEWGKEVQGLLDEIFYNGLEVEDLWDLVNTRQPYPEAIDILVKHLPLNYHPKNKEGIIRALNVKDAKGKASKALIAEYENTPIEKDNLRWVIGCSIATTMETSDIAWIISTVSDKSNGGSRSALVEALGKVKSEEVEDLLIQLLDDDAVAAQAVCSLGKLKSQKAKEKIQSLTRSMNALVRLSAQKAIKKL